MKFEAFKKICADAGLQATDHGQGHWRITGGLLKVNWYPLSKGSTVWVNGTTGRTSFRGGAQQAIEAALGNAPTLAPGLVPTKRPKREWSKALKKKWRKYGRSKRCHWCHSALAPEAVTVDHVVPLHRGGSNMEDNLVPACYPCNKKRGHDLGAPKEAVQ